MFSFRRKPKKADENPPFIRTSPSLPELSAQGIPWPSNLVDLSQLPQEAPPRRGAAKTSFSADVAQPVPFHKPWSSPGKATDSPTGPPIASLYTHPPPSAFETRKTSIQGRHRPSQKRNRNPTTFNLMVRATVRNACASSLTTLWRNCSCGLVVCRLLARKARARRRFFV